MPLRSLGKSCITVLHIINNLDQGGAETTLYRLLSQLDRNRFNPVVISLMGRGSMGKQIQGLGVTVHPLGMSAGRPKLTALRVLKNLVDRLQPDLIQGWMYYGNLVASLAALISRPIPVLWNIRHTPSDLKAEKHTTALVIRLGAHLSRKTSAIIYNSRSGATCHEMLGYQRQKRIVIPNGFNLSRLTPSGEARFSLRQELGVGESCLLIGLVGNFRPEKDHETFLKGAAALALKYPNVLFVLVGFNVDAANPLLSKLIGKMNLVSKVRLLGQRHDVLQLMSAFDIASSSSRSEAFPNVVAEAMACGVPCVATNVGDSAWIVGETGIVVPPGDPQALANGWERLIALGDNDRQCLGARARHRIQEHFSLPKMIRAYQQLHEDLAGSENTPALSRIPFPPRPSLQTYEHPESRAHYHG